MIEYIENKTLGEGYYKITHGSGLAIYVYPKEGYNSSYAVFGTNYGSVDTCFKRSDRDGFTTIPAGTAHFLEHKLFESEELGAFERYAKTGASANAYTGFDRTCYLFSCTGSFKENFEILIDFVRHPYFTEETVRKEQGIIGQEIDMYRDVPDWECLFNMLKCMYHTHPVKTDIAGTKESISQITAQMLHECYATFYNLGNMALAVAGNVTPEEVVEVADRLIKPDADFTVERAIEKEPETIVKPYIEGKLSVVTPVFVLGFKDSRANPLVSLKDEIGMTLLLDIIAGQMSSLYEELLDEGLINGSFSCEYFNGHGYDCQLFSGESKDPEKTAKAIKDKIKEFKKSGISKEDFEIARRKQYGKTVRAFSDIDTLANGLVVSHFSGEKLFSEFNILQEIDLDCVNGLLETSFDENKCVLSVINPL